MSMSANETPASVLATPGGPMSTTRRAPLETPPEMAAARGGSPSPDPSLRGVPQHAESKMPKPSSATRAEN
eukprot:11219404-Lingulodinium_polyedra.AAC.1